MKIIVAFLIALLAAPAPAAVNQSQVAAYRALIEQDLRLATVGYRLAAANAPFCSRTIRDLGWVLHDQRQYPDEAVARAAFGFSQPVSVAAAVDGGPSAKVGVKSGDGLAGVNGHVWDWEGQDAAKLGAQRLETLLDQLDSALAQPGLVTLKLQNAQGIRTFTLDPPPVCASRFWVDVRDSKDAGADGDKVRITSGMMAYVADDAEVAAVVAHEFAHNILGHRARLAAKRRGKGNSVLATEIEADRLSVWLMANAGYDPQAALRFAERYGRQFGLGIFSDGTHQRWKRRVAVMQAEIDLMAQTPKTNGKLPPPLLISK